jgi:signal transduction histidine kinase/ligand-binding sensor domain-containing protein
MHCRPLQLMMMTWTMLFGSMWELKGEDPDLLRASKQFHVQRWTVDDGLPQSRVACLKQTRDGFLWIGTWTGLVRFDGVRFTVFNKFNTPELLDDPINALAEDEEGTLWIGTRTNLLSYRDHRFHAYEGQGDFAKPDISRLAACRGGGIWIQWNNYVAKLKGREFSKIWKVGDGSSLVPRSIEESPDGRLNVFTSRSWVSLAPDAVAMSTNYAEASGTKIFWAGLVGKSSGSVYLGTSLGLMHLEDGVLGPVPDEAFDNRQVDLLFKDRLGDLWLNVPGGGLHRWDGKESERFTLDQGSTICMTEDFAGNIWVGNERGLSCLQRQGVRTYTMHDGLPDDNVLSVCEGADGVVWIGTSRGLAYVGPHGVGRPQEQEPLPDRPDRSVWPSPGAGVFIGKPGVGLLRYEEGGFKNLSQKYWTDVNMNMLYEDRSGRLWAGTKSGAFAFKDHNFRDPCASITNSLDLDARSMLDDGKGSLWVGTFNRGMARFQNGTLTFYYETNGLSNNKIWSILEDEECTLWIGTDNGLTRYANGRFFPFTQASGLPERSVNCVLEDDEGRLWLSGIHGIHRVEREQLNAVANGRAATAQFFTVGSGDGMENPETNGGENQPAGWKARDGRLWFPTIEGVVVIDPKLFPTNEPPPRVAITEVRAGDRLLMGDPIRKETEAKAGVKAALPPKDAESKYRLAPGSANVMEFRFSANTFVKAENTRFRYRLVNADRNWREETGERTVRYINLDPGDYIFEVTAANHHNVWNPTPAQFKFTLEHHFWETWTFYGICGAAVIGLAAAVQGYRLNWQHRLLKSEEQKALANQRTRIARDLHDDLGTALTGLALELDVVGREAKAAGSVSGRLGRISHRTRELAERMREVVWTVNPKCDTVSSLADFLEQQVEQFLRVDGVRVRLDFPENIPAIPLGGEARHQLALGVREALTNVIRHADARQVNVSLTLADQWLVLKVQDDGRGFSAIEKRGNGLANIRARLEQIGGTFECTSAPASGTIVTLRVPLPDRNGTEKI